MTTITSTLETRPKALHVALWIAQVIVAGMFTMVGFLKTFTPIADLSQIMPLAQDSPVLIRFIGIVELLGAIGLILPAALKIAPKLTVFAAYGLVLTMVLAFLFHLLRGELSATPITVVLGLLSGFIAWGRSTKARLKSSTRIFEVR
jgi:hypothetical protein